MATYIPVAQDNFKIVSTSVSPFSEVLYVRYVFSKYAKNVTIFCYC
jgi:hypothetical protein